MASEGPPAEVEAQSASVRIDRTTPRMAQLTFGMSDGGSISIPVPRHILAWVILQAQRAMKAAPLPARGRPPSPAKPRGGD